MKGLVITLVLLIVFGSGIYVAGKYHFVNTRDGIKVYHKDNFTFAETYVDMKNMSFIELRNHLSVVKVMANAGDLRYIPGGQTLEKIGKVGIAVTEAVTKFDDEYHVSSSLKEIERIGLNKYRSLDEKYDITNKAEKASEIITEKTKGAAEKLNNWLKTK